MNFKPVTSYPQNIDTVIHFFQYDANPAFLNQELKASYHFAFDGDSVTYKAGDINIFRMKVSYSFVNIILVATDLASEEKGFDSFRKTCLKLGTKLNELKAKNIYIDNLEVLSFKNKAELSRQLSSTLPLCDYAFDKYKEKKAEYTKKDIYVYTNTPCLEAALLEGANIAKGICIARDLTNEPSDVADLHNTSTGGAGGICAGLFLDEFKEEKPFIHLDVAGMTFTQKKRDGYPKGGTGYGVKTVYEYIKG